MKDKTRAQGTQSRESKSPSKSTMVPDIPAPNTAKANVGHILMVNLKPTVNEEDPSSHLRKGTI